VDHFGGGVLFSLPQMLSRKGAGMTGIAGMAVCVCVCVGRWCRLQLLDLKSH
jgi:hypothetical protein